MNTAISSKRVFEQVGGKEETSSGVFYGFTFFIGLLLLIVGIEMDIALVAGAGFVGFHLGVDFFAGFVHYDIFATNMRPDITVLEITE